MKTQCRYVPVWTYSIYLTELDHREDGGEIEARNWLAARLHLWRSFGLGSLFLSVRRTGIQFYCSDGSAGSRLKLSDASHQ